MRQIIYIAIIALLVGTNAGYAQKKQPSYKNRDKAFELLEENNEKEAVRYLSLQLNETPEDADIYMLRSVLYGRQKQYGLALADANNAVKYWNKKGRYHQWQAYITRARAYRALEEYDKAFNDYGSAYKYAQKVSVADTNEVLDERAETYVRTKQYDRAEADYRQILKNDETDQNAMLNLVRIMILREEYDPAWKLASKSIRYDSECGEAYRLRMKIYDLQGETDKAIDDAINYIKYDEGARSEYCVPTLKKHPSYAIAKINEMINTDGDRSWRYIRAIVYEASHDYAKAIAEYDALERDYGSYYAIHYHRANCYDEVGEHDKAAAEMTRCIELSDGKDYEAVVGRADYYRTGGHYELAIADFTRGIELEPTSAYPYYKRGWCYELMGDDEKAMENYNAGIDINKEYPYIFLMRGEMYLKHGETEKAKADFEEIIKQDTLVYGSCRHYALHFLGRDDEAAEWMEKIIADDPTDNSNYYDKSCLMARMGRLEEAVEALRKAFELGYRSFAHIEHDDDMDAIRELPEFKALIEEYKAKPIFIDRADNEDRDSVATVSEVDMKKMYGGTYEVPCIVNDLPLKFIFDTGASSVSISSVEASFMLKNDYLKSDDIKGKEYFSTATGEIHEGTTIRLREIKIGDAVLRNVDASVVHNQQAPLLLGQSVLERFGTITIDNINSKLIIKQKQL